MDPRIRRYLWQRPRTHREVITERRVSFLELFYDLVYVVLIARVAHGLHGSISVEAVATFVVLFGLLWVGWFNGTLLHDAHGRPDMRNRLMTFLQMFAIAVMAVFAPTADAAGGLGFAVSYTLFLVILVVQWFRVARTEASDPLYGPVARQYTFLMAAMTAWIGASIFVPASQRVWMWGGFLAVYLGAMVLITLVASGRGTVREDADPMATDSMLERYGLFIIIVLGEVVAGVVAGLGAVDDITPVVFLTGFVGLAVGIAFWWTYFDMVGQRAPRKTTSAVYLYTLAQLPLGLAIAGVGAATVSLIEHTDGPYPAANWTFAGFVTLAMLSLGMIARLLPEWDSLAAVLRPATSIGYVISLVALGLAAANTSGLVLASVLFVAMCGQWVYAVHRWLGTPEGQSQVDAANSPVAYRKG